MARLFSVPRQIGGGGGAGFTRLFVQRQQHQLRHWFVYHFTTTRILLSFIPKTSILFLPSIPKFARLI